MTPDHTWLSLAASFSFSKLATKHGIIFPLRRHSTMQSTSPDNAPPQKAPGVHASGRFTPHL